MIEVKVPGKLYIAGEYAVVNPGHKAMVMAINKFLKVNIKKAKNSGSVKSYSNIKMIWVRKDDEIIVEQIDNRFEYIFSAINIVEKYLIKKEYKLDLYDISVKSELESEEGIKYGLGSSAAVVVAIVKSILKYYKYPYTNEEIFKLSALSSILVNSDTSCGDIASAVYTGIIVYSSFSRKNILERYKIEEIDKLINSDWEYLSIEKIDINSDIDFNIGWTKSPASSSNLVSKSIKNKKNNIEFYNKFLNESDICVDNIYNAYKISDFEKLKFYIEKNRELLNEYAKNYNIEIEKTKLKELIEIAKKLGLASKTSGAGGGDCGIAISKKSFDKIILENEWKKNSIEKLDMNIFEESNE